MKSANSNENAIQGQSIGIDVSKDSLDCCFCEQRTDKHIVIKGTQKFPNTKQGFEKLDAWIKKRLKKDYRLSLVMEATGVYYEEVALYFSEQTDYKVSVVLPNKSKAFKQSLNSKSKNDQEDAKVLAIMGLERNLGEWQAPDKAMQQIRTFCRERSALLETKGAISNQLHAIEHSTAKNKHTTKRIESLLHFIDKQLRAIENDLKNSICQDVSIDLKVKQLTSIPGVGWITAIYILAETNNFALFKNKRQLVSYAGLDIVENQSGKTAGKTRISKKGNSRLRKALYFPALAHVREASIYSPLFDRLYQHSCNKMKAYVAVQRKLLTLMYALHKNNTYFDPNFSRVE